MIDKLRYKGHCVALTQKNNRTLLIDGQTPWEIRASVKVVNFEMQLEREYKTKGLQNDRR